MSRSTHIQMIPGTTEEQIFELAALADIPNMFANKFYMTAYWNAMMIYWLYTVSFTSDSG